MSKIKALEKLREYTQGMRKQSVTPGHNPCADEVDNYLDEIECEIVERFIKLPVDAVGVPIHIGDKIVIGVLNKITCTVEKLEFDGHEWWYKNGDDYFACSGARHIPRTLEDVLHDVWEEAIDYSKSVIWRNPDEVFAERADEIRTMFGEIDHD